MTATIRLGDETVFARERIKKDFLQFTVIAVFAMGRAEGPLQVTARHVGGMRRRGVKFRGNQKLADVLDCNSVCTALLPLDFTRLEVSGGPGGFKTEIETYGASMVVMRMPRVRRYVPMGQEQGRQLLGAFAAIAASLSRAFPTSDITRESCRSSR